MSRYPCKAWLIDPFAVKDGRFSEIVTETTFNGDHRQIYDHLSAPGERRVDAFQIVPLHNGDVMYVDEEGLLHGDPKAWIATFGFPEPIAGRGLVLGRDDPEHKAPKADFDWLRKYTMVCYEDREVFWDRGADGALEPVDRTMPHGQPAIAHWMVKLFGRSIGR